MPRFLLLPGLDGTGELLHEPVAALRALGPVQVLHYPQQGEQSYAALAAALREQAGDAAGSVIVAESFGGPLGIALAQAIRPQALVLCASFVSSPLPLLRPLAGLLPMMPLQALPTRIVAALLLGRWATPERVARLDRVWRSLPQALPRQRLQAVLGADARAVLAGLSCRLLYLQASHDRLIPRACVHCIAALRPDLRCVRLQAPHFLLQAAPEAAVAAIADFLAAPSPV